MLHSIGSIDRDLLLLALVFSENTQGDVVQGLRSSLQGIPLDSNVYVQTTRVGVKQQYTVAEVGDVVLLSIPGTRMLRDLLVDGNVSRKQLPWTRGVAGYVHGGFLDQSLSIPVESLYRHFVQTQGKKMIICGHSLGGALAVLCTIRMLQILDQSSRDMELIRCFTFGSPGVGDEGVKKYIHGQRWDNWIVNVIVDDDPIAYLTAYYKHIGKVVRLKGTGAPMLEKHRMRNYRRHVRGSLSVRSEGHLVQCRPGVLVPPPQITRVVCRSGSGDIFIEGANLSLVTHAGIVYLESGARACRIIEKTHARLVAWYDVDTLPFHDECCQPHIALYTDFDTSSYPIRVLRKVVWVLSIDGDQQQLPNHSLVEGADVWEVTSKIQSLTKDSIMSDVVFVLNVLSLYFGARMQQGQSVMQRFRLQLMKGHLSHVFQTLPNPDCLLICSHHMQDENFYHAIYPLSGRLPVRISHSEFLGAELKRKVEIISGVQHVLDDQQNPGVSIKMFMKSQQQKLQYRYNSRL